MRFLIDCTVVGDQTGSRAHRHAVLIVEDDADLRDGLVALLEMEGYDPVAVCTGREALAALRDGPHPCVILLDLAMPDMDGYEFRRVQMADPTLAEIPIIVVSAGGYASEADARKLGMDVYLRKPMDFDRFVEAVHRLCREGRLR